MSENRVGNTPAGGDKPRCSLTLAAVTEGAHLSASRCTYQQGGPVTRRLVSVRRTVAEDRRQDYDRLWADVRRAAEERGAHAWRFAASGGDAFMEFLEAAEPGRLVGPELEAAREALERIIGGGSTEVWEEAP